MDGDQFSNEERNGLYKAIRSRRDIRRFRPDPIPDDLLQRILVAGHQAPSVGFMQPWNFILISSQETRQRVKKNFEEKNQEQSAKVESVERAGLYRSLKLEGIMESPLNLAITCDHRRDAPFVLGRGPMPQTDEYSVCLAIQNMWLAARVEGIGLGWVSILDYDHVSQILGLPEGVKLIAYLCVGYPLEFTEKPMLETVGWKQREPIENVIYHEKWGSTSL